MTDKLNPVRQERKEIESAVVWIIRRPYVQIDNDNVTVLQLLDLLKNLDRYLDCSYDEARKKIKNIPWRIKSPGNH